MNKFFKSKKALEAKILISIIILLIGFVIIVVAFYNIDWKNQTNIEACHTSVIARMSLPDKFINSAKDIIPLNCQTKKICVTDKMFGKGNCEEEFGEEFITLRLTDKNKENQINAILAEELAESWNVMGQGKGRIFSKKFWSSETVCVMYSIIDFDNTVLKKIKHVDNFGEYLFKNKVPNSNQYYSQFLYNEDNYDERKDKFKEIELNKKALVFYEAHGPTAMNKVATMFVTTGGALVGFSLGGPLGLVIGGVAGASFGQNIGAKFNEDFFEKKYGKEGYLSGFYFVDYNSDSLKELGCKSFENLV